MPYPIKETFIMSYSYFKVSGHHFGASIVESRTTKHGMGSRLLEGIEFSVLYDASSCFLYVIRVHISTEGRVSASKIRLNESTYREVEGVVVANLHATYS